MLSDNTIVEIDVHGLRGHRMIRIGAMGEGDCFFHALLRGISAEYREADTDRRRRLVRRYRVELSEKLTEEVYNDLVINNFMENTPKEFTLKVLKYKITTPGVCVDHYMLEAIMRVSEYNFVILEDQSSVISLYRGALDPSMYSPKLGIVLILYTGNAHYELIAEVLDSDHMRTVFDIKNPTVQNFVK